MNELHPAKRSRLTAEPAQQEQQNTSLSHQLLESQLMESEEHLSQLSSLPIPLHFREHDDDDSVASGSSEEAMDALVRPLVGLHARGHIGDGAVDIPDSQQEVHAMAVAMAQVEREGEVGSNMFSERSHQF